MCSVLVVTPWFPNRPGDRQGNFVYGSVAALVRHGVAVSVLVTRAWVPGFMDLLRPAWVRGRLEPEAFGDLPIMELVRFPSIPRNHLRPLSNWLCARRVGPALENLAKRSGVDLIHAHTEGPAAIAVSVARKLNIPAVVTIHGINTAPRYIEAPRQRRLFRQALNGADRVILVGEPLRAFFASIAGRDDHFRVVPNGFQPPSADPPARSDGWGPTIRFISVSNLHEGKGIDINLQALALLRKAGFVDWSYAVVGDGDERRSLEALAGSLGISTQVRFLGAPPHERIYELLTEADVFILPSYREAFGIVYLEAMACGLLTIGVRGQGPQAFIEHGRTGFLVEPRDPESLAGCIREVFRRRERMKEIAFAGATVARCEFSWDRHADRLMEVYRELIPGHG